MEDTCAAISTFRPVAFWTTQSVTRLFELERMFVYRTVPIETL